MNEVVTYSIVNNEISYIKDIIEYHLQWVDAMYFLDTGSTDGTLEYLKNISATNPRIIFEEYYEKYTPQYELDWHDIPNPFPEVIVRNHAIKRTEQLLNPKWIIQLDGDEVWLSQTKNILLQTKEDILCIGCSTINPACELHYHPIENRQGLILYDPHVRIWRANHKVMYMANHAVHGKQIHCIPTIEGFGQHLFHWSQTKFITDILHMHLHWVYGKKMELFYKQKGASKEEMINSFCTNEFSILLPKLFWNQRNQWIKNLTIKD